MALTIVTNHATVMGDVKVRFVTITMDSSYPTGGEAVAKTDFALDSAILHIQVADNTGGNTVHWDKANSKLLVYTADGTQATNGSNQSAVSCSAIVVGK